MYDNKLSAGIEFLSEAASVRELEQAYSGTDLNPRTRELHRGLIADRVNQLYGKYASILAGTPEGEYLRALRREYIGQTKPKIEESRLILERPIDELPLDDRQYTALTNAKIRTILELVQNTDEQLLFIKGFGRKSLKKLKKILAGIGLETGMSPDELFE
tara:strand:- start:7908 stop:8387 length:480 start_codon:yes stop_codon:yes gene_type:complete